MVMIWSNSEVDDYQCGERRSSVENVVATKPMQPMRL